MENIKKRCASGPAILRHGSALRSAALRPPTGFSPAMILLGLLWLGLAPPVDACSCILPPGRWLVAYDEVLPANAVGIPGWFLFDGKDFGREGFESHIEVYELHLLDVRKPVAFKLDFLQVPPKDPASGVKGKAAWGQTVFFVRPKGFGPGKRYLVAWGNELDPKRARALFRSRELRVQVGHDRLEAGPAKLRTEAPDRDWTQSGRGVSCVGSFDAQRVRVELELPEAARPFKGSLLYYSTVDGVPWNATQSACQPKIPGRSWIAPGEDLFFAPCGTGDLSGYGDMLDAAPHEAELGAWLPGTDVTFRAQATIDLTCDGDPPEPVNQGQPRTR